MTACYIKLKQLYFPIFSEKCSNVGYRHLTALIFKDALAAGNIETNPGPLSGEEELYKLLFTVDAANPEMQGEDRTTTDFIIQNVPT